MQSHLLDQFHFTFYYAQGLSECQRSGPKREPTERHISKKPRFTPEVANLDMILFC